VKRAIIFLLLCLVFTLPVGAQENADAARDREITAVDGVLDQIRNEVNDGGTIDVRETENHLRELLRESRARIGPVIRALENAEQGLSQLGPPPKEGEPPESEPLAERREELRLRISSLQGQRTRILSNIDNETSLLATLSARRVALLYRNLLQRQSSLLTPILWSGSAAEASALAEKFQHYFVTWGKADTAGLSLLMRLTLLFGAFLLSILLIGPVHRWMQRAFTRRLTESEPTQGRRVAVAGVKMISRLVPGIIGGLVVIETARVIGLLGPDGFPVARAIWIALIAALLVEGFTSGLFAPAAPGWRIADVEAAKGRHASRLLLAIVIIFGLKTVATATSEATAAGPAFPVLLAGCSAVAVGALLILLCRRRLWERASPQADTEKSDDRDASFDVWSLLRRSGRLVGVGIIAAALAGYIALADFVAARFYYLALILAIVWFLRAALKEAGAWAEVRLRSRREAEAPRDDKHIAQFWIGAVVDFVLLTAIAPALLILLGFSWRSVRDMVVSAFMGFRIGGVTISFADIFWAIGLFTAIFALTRLVQRGLEHGPFAHSRLDIGVQNSLTTVLGYIGLLIAIVVSITALGFDLSNLALIAGALSVGIGFGLQSVVNNFVSGLILLFERPIKVGDWVVTSSGEGIVKKISVRSTEIETFDRSTIIVPNSELISSTVTNWTHRSKLGRIKVPVGVSYNADPEKVNEILLKCAKGHPLISGYPEPFVVWQEFGASSLDFEIRAYLRDIGDSLTVKSELRFAIFKALKEAGIEIPYPQRDLHVKSWTATPAPAAPVAASVALAEVEQPENGGDE
jgi:small-conductance mechanosensitive channel